MTQGKGAADSLGYGDVSPFVRLLARQGRVKILDVFLRQPHDNLSAPEIAKLADISTSTFHRNIDVIQELGIIEEVGEKSGTTYYRLNTESTVAKAFGKTHQELLHYQQKVLESTEPTNFNSTEYAVSTLRKHDDSGDTNEFKIPPGKKLQ